MELSAFEIIKRAVITSKSIDMYKRFGQITFEVHKDANKVMIKGAIEKLWDVKVAVVRTNNIAGKNKIFARKPFTTPSRKKAIISLKKGYKIEIPGMFEMMGAAEGESKASGHSRLQADKA